VLGGEAAGELLGEVLDHVVAFGLAVHQDVEAGLLLEGDHLVDLRLDAPSYSAVLIRPVRWSAPAVHSSPVCGKDPMVVVGSRGRPRWARWAAARSAYGWARRASAS
jgi:hypothetical protein